MGAAIAASASLLASARGPGLSPDSVIYLTTGINLADAGSLESLSGSTLTLFPPAMPFVAAAGELAAVGAQTSVRVFVALATAAVVVLANAHLGAVVSRPGVRDGATAAIATSAALLTIGARAWSEAPFVAVSLAFLWALPWRTGGSVRARSLLVPSLLCWLAFGLRYAGLVLIAVGVAWLIAEVPGTVRQRLVCSGKFAILAGALPATWMVRNLTVDGHLMGPRGNSSATLVGSIGDLVTTTGLWLIPVEELPTGALALVGVAVLACVVVGVSGATREGRAPIARPETTARETTRLLRAHIWLLAVYVPYLLAATLYTTLDPIDARLLSPAFVPAAVVISHAIDRQLLRREPRPRVRAAALALAASLLIVQVSSSARIVRAGLIGGLGFNGRTWTESEVARAAQAHSTRSGHTQPIYSDEPWALWSATGLQPIKQLPGASTAPDQMASTLRGLEGQVACEPQPALLVIYSMGRGIDLSTLERVLVLEPVEELADGTLFNAVARTACDPDASPEG